MRGAVPFPKRDTKMFPPGFVHGCGIEGFGIRVSNFGVLISGFGFWARVSVLESWLLGLSFGVEGLGIRNQG